MKNLNFMSEHRSKLNEKIKACKNKCDSIASKITELHLEAEKPCPLMIDEVAFAFVAALRVGNWETLGDEFGGYKIGRIFAFVLEVLNDKIEDSVSQTIDPEMCLKKNCRFWEICDCEALSKGEK